MGCLFSMGVYCPDVQVDSTYTGCSDHFLVRRRKQLFNHEWEMKPGRGKPGVRFYVISHTPYLYIKVSFWNIYRREINTLHAIDGPLE